ncbi:hypothetical protein PFISCL1PPCAC_207, partial [Pristionchus fissidentatus]
KMALFSEEDIHEELIAMGYTPSRKLIEDLRKAIARADAQRETDENFESTHPFAALDIESKRPAVRGEARDGVRGTGGGGVEQSPLVLRSRNPMRWNPQIPQAIDTITFHTPRLDGLVGEAYKSIGNMYEFCDELEDLKDELENLDLAKVMEEADRKVRMEREGGGEGEEEDEEEGSEDSDASTARDVDDDERRGARERDDEMVQRIRERRTGAAAEKLWEGVSERGATTVASGGGSVMETLPGAVGLEPGLRPVLVPAPGRRPFRFDPVNKFGIYQQEWKRLPAPGDKKRLSLRWKIREQLLHRDMPVFDRDNDQNAMRVPPLNHPKDWSPRPYLD